MKKIYVKEQIKKDSDGKELQIVKAYPSDKKPERFTYLIFLEK